MEHSLLDALILMCVLPSVRLYGEVMSLSERSFQSTCFQSCVCYKDGWIHCIDSPDLVGKVVEFNDFLLNNITDMRSPTVHFQMTKAKLPDFLSDLPAVQYLSLVANNISCVQKNVLNGMQLRELNLSCNSIQTVQEKAFQDLHNLHVLDLSHNNLTSASRLMFYGAPNLQVLNLSFNQVVYFAVDAFEEVPNLQTLILNYNKLSYLMPGSLISLFTLHFLGLRNNSLKSFHVNVTSELPSLKELDISGNPFSCPCALKGLQSMNSDSVKKIMLIESNKTRCLTPAQLQGKLVDEIILDLDSCPKPIPSMSYVSHDVLYGADVQLNCDIERDDDSAVLWLTPWGHKFADVSHWPQLEAVCDSCEQQRQYGSISISLVSQVSVLGGGESLKITNFRSFFNGNITCHTFNFLGNNTAVHRVAVYSTVQSYAHHSYIIGGLCATGCLCLGLIIGSIKLLVLACLKSFGKKRNIIRTPMNEAVSTNENNSLREDTSSSSCKDDSEDFNDFYPPETPFTTPISTTPPSTPQKYHTPGSGEDTPPGGWLPSNIIDTMEEVRWRLRYGVGRKMETVKRNVQTIKETSMRNVQSFKESGSLYVHNIMESGSLAANKVKAGVVLSMETVKLHVQSIKEFCGTGDMGTQTISMISVETNLDTNETREVVKSITFV